MDAWQRDAEALSCSCTKRRQKWRQRTMTAQQQVYVLTKYIYFEMIRFRLNSRLPASWPHVRWPRSEVCLVRDLWHLRGARNQASQQQHHRILPRYETIQKVCQHIVGESIAVGKEGGCPHHMAAMLGEQRLDPKSYDCLLHPPNCLRQWKRVHHKGASCAGSDGWGWGDGGRDGWGEAAPCVGRDESGADRSWALLELRSSR